MHYIIRAVFLNKQDELEVKYYPEWFGTYNMDKDNDTGWTIELIESKITAELVEDGCSQVKLTRKIVRE